MIMKEHPIQVAERKEEAKLFRQCAKLTEVSIQIAAVLQQRTTIEAEERTDPELWALHDRQEKIQKRILSLRPVTSEGWVALARACMLDTWFADGEVICDEPIERIAWRIVAEVAGVPPRNG